MAESGEGVFVHNPGLDPVILQAFGEQVGEFAQALAKLAVQKSPLREEQRYEALRMSHRFQGDALFLQLEPCHRFAQAADAALQNWLQVGSLPNSRLHDLFCLLEARRADLTHDLSSLEEQFILASCSRISPH